MTYNVWSGTLSLYTTYLGSPWQKGRKEGNNFAVVNTANDLQCFMAGHSEAFR